MSPLTGKGFMQILNKGLKVVTSEKGEAVGEVLTVTC
jgi:hypothetical protein